MDVSAILAQCLGFHFFRSSLSNGGKILSVTISYAATNMVYMLYSSCSHFTTSSCVLFTAPTVGISIPYSIPKMARIRIETWCSYGVCAMD
jgi:hypothetical protein